MLAKFFVQNRPHWQKKIFIDDLEGEGYLALTKAARTYDKARLPYPKAYFCRAIMNSMYKWIKRSQRMPGDWKISLQEAADLMPVVESPDYLKLAIEDLGEDAELATDRFANGHTLRRIAEDHDISLRLASVRSRELARTLAAALDIRLSPHAPAAGCPSHGSSRCNPSSSSVSERRRGPKR
jgi:DNA-directed RNA polymerase specialized sigma24 family protein